MVAVKPAGAGRREVFAAAAMVAALVAARAVAMAWAEAVVTRAVAGAVTRAVPTAARGDSMATGEPMAIVGVAVVRARAGAEAVKATAEAGRWQCHSHTR